MSTVPYQANVVVANSIIELPHYLNTVIVQSSVRAIEQRGIFTIALSGGSIPTFLQSITDAFVLAGIRNPNYDKWHILLADERCVPIVSDDSNLGLIRRTVLSSITSIPESNVHGINENLLYNDDESSHSTTSTTAAIANDYEIKLKNVLNQSMGKLDLAVLGFGPDGHTCSLFPNHTLLNEISGHVLVASIDDSPKPPPKRITLTLPVLNSLSREIVFCGAGTSKSTILYNVFKSIKPDTTTSTTTTTTTTSCPATSYAARQFIATYTDPPPYPCAMVRPKQSSENDILVTWIVDEDAMKDFHLPTKEQQINEQQS